MGHIENHVNLLLVVGDVFHGLKLLLKRVQILVELLRLHGDCAATASSRCGWDRRVTWRRRHFTVLISVELIDLVVDVIERVIDTCNLVGRIPRPNDLLALVQVLL